MAVACKICNFDLVLYSSFQEVLDHNSPLSVAEEVLNAGHEDHIF